MPFVMPNQPVSLVLVVFVFKSSQRCALVSGMFMQVLHHTVLLLQSETKNEQSLKEQMCGVEQRYLICGLIFCQIICQL